MLHTQTMVIDADAHVLESERTWDYLSQRTANIGPSPSLFPPTLRSGVDAAMPG